MKIHYQLKTDLSSLRKEISLEKLANEIYSTAPTLFRIEKNHWGTNKEIMDCLASYFEIKPEDLYEEVNLEEEGQKKIHEYLQDKVEALYCNKSIDNEDYNIMFLNKQNKGNSYSVFSSLYWISNDNDGNEIRGLRKLFPQETREYLEKNNLKCAFINSVDDLFFFYWGIPEDEEFYAAVIMEKLSKEKLSFWKEKYIVKEKNLFQYLAFRDCEFL